MKKPRLSGAVRFVRSVCPRFDFRANQLLTHTHHRCLNPALPALEAGYPTG